MENKKNNKRGIILIVIIIVILSILYVLFATETVNLKTNNIDNNKTNQNITDINSNGNNISKLDNSKEWIYDANYKLPTNKEDNNYTNLINASNLVVPYINIDSADAKKANQEIYKLYEDLISMFNKDLKEEFSTVLAKYETYSNNDIISIIITTKFTGTDAPMYKHYTYNFNLVDGKLLSYNEIYKTAGLSENNITDKANQAITSTLSRKYPNGDDFDTYNNKSINNYNTSVNNDTIKFFVDENKELNIIVTLEIPAGRGQFDTIITVK